MEKRKMFLTTACPLTNGVRITMPQQEQVLKSWYWKTLIFYIKYLLYFSIALFQNFLKVMVMKKSILGKSEVNREKIKVNIDLEICNGVIKNDTFLEEKKMR